MADENVFAKIDIEENETSKELKEMKNQNSYNSIIQNNKSSIDEKFHKKRRNYRISSLIEREIPNYIKSFKDEIGKTFSEVNNFESKNLFFSIESKYEQIILPDNNYYNKSSILRQPQKFIYNTENLFNNDKDICSEKIKENFIKERIIETNNDQKLYDNNIMGNTDAINDLNNSSLENGDFDLEKNNHKLLNRLSVNKFSSKFGVKRNLVYLHNIKRKNQRQIGFDIHIRDAEDSAFEKLIID